MQEVNIHNCEPHCDLNETTVQERRMADAGWVRRWKRSLGRNKNYRARVRAGHELREAMEKMAKADETDKKSAVLTVLSIARQKNTIGNMAHKFMNMVRRGRS